VSDTISPSLCRPLGQWLRWRHLCADHLPRAARHRLFERPTVRDTQRRIATVPGCLVSNCQIRLDKVRRFWLDKKTATLEQSFELSYQPLSERYVVRNLNSGEQKSFATLFSALNSMGRIVDLPIIDASLLDADERYEIALRAVLDQNTLPGPLRLLAFWSSGFRLESDWYVWMLNA